MKHAILLVAYGVATLKGRRVLMDIDAQTRALFPKHSVRWAYSSALVRKRLALEGLKSDSVAKALLRMYFERFESVLVQPLQIIPGKEHEDMLAQIAQVVAKHPLSVQVGMPLLSCDADTHRVAMSLLRALPKDRDVFEDVVFMGHGSKHPAGIWYEKLHTAIQQYDGHVFVGTMEGTFNLEVLLPKLVSNRVWLMPLFATVGRHTLHDMAGASPSSWRSKIESCGHSCQVVLQGSAEYASLVALWLDHLNDAARNLL